MFVNDVLNDNNDLYINEINLFQLESITMKRQKILYDSLFNFKRMHSSG